MPFLMQTVASQDLEAFDRALMDEIGWAAHQLMDEAMRQGHSFEEAAQMVREAMQAKDPAA